MDENKEQEQEQEQEQERFATDDTIEMLRAIESKLEGLYERMDAIAEMIVKTDAGYDIDGIDSDSVADIGDAIADEVIGFEDLDLKM